MNLLFDLSATQPNHGNDYHGGSEFAKVVFYKLCEELHKNINIEVFYNPNKAIDKNIISGCLMNNINIIQCKNNDEISSILNKNQYDVFFSALPYTYYDLKIPEKTKFIYTVHGLRTLEQPWNNNILKYENPSIIDRLKINLKIIINILFPNFWKKYLRKRDMDKLNPLFSRTNNQIIITISQHSKYAINYFFNSVDISKLHVLYPPIKSVDLNLENENAILKEYSLQSMKYILLISGDRAEKGAYLGCKAIYKLFSSKQKEMFNDFKIIVVGVSYKKPYLDLVNNSSQFIFTDYVLPLHLEILYKNAFLFLFPSLSEGFGYSPLEAMKHGTLCAISANSALTEIFKDAPLYFNPDDETEIGIRILQSFDNSIRANKIERIKENYKMIREKQNIDLEKLIDIITKE